MSFNYLSTSSIENFSKMQNAFGGIVDKKRFKTASIYGFDSVYFDKVTIGNVGQFI